MLPSNLDTCPLLRLPREIKDQIYGFVFTPEAVHIHDFFGEASILEKKPNGQLYHHRCDWTIENAIEREAHASSHRHDFAETWQKSRYTHQAACCWNSTPCKRHLIPSSVRVLSLLLTCHQTNNDARNVLYANTTFCFDSWDVIQKFIARTTPLSLLGIRGIRIEIQTGSDIHHIWWTQTLLELCTAMTNLCRVHIEIDQNTPRWQHPRSFPMSMDDENGLKKGLMYLANLPLKELIVLIFDLHFMENLIYSRWRGEREKGTDLFGRWPLARKQQFVENLKRMVLRRDHHLEEANEA